MQKNVWAVSHPINRHGTSFNIIITSHEKSVPIFSSEFDGVFFLKRLLTKIKYFYFKIKNYILDDNYKKQLFN